MDTVDGERKRTLTRSFSLCPAQAIAAGAHGAFLSGAGSTILALTSGRRGDVFVQRSDERKEREVSDAMLAAARAHNMPGKIYVTQPVELGAHVVEVEPLDATAAV